MIGSIQSKSINLPVYACRYILCDNDVDVSVKVAKVCPDCNVTISNVERHKKSNGCRMHLAEKMAKKLRCDACERSFVRLDSHLKQVD